MSKGKPAFSDLDVGKVGFAFPGFDVESIVATQRKNLAALTQANQLAVEAAQAIARRQVELARQAVDDAASFLRDLTQPGAPKERLARNAEVTKLVFEKGIANARELTDLVAKANTEAFNVLNKRVTEGFEEVRDYAKQHVAR